MPDIHAAKDELALAVEVYCPRAWPDLDAYTQGLTDRVKHLDRALDYAFRIEHSQLEQLDPDHKLLDLYPGVLDDALDESTRLAAVAGLFVQLEAALAADAAPVAEIELAALNLKTRIELGSVTATRSRLPGRNGVISGPSISGYRPESMFERAIAGVVSKLKKGQALSVADAVPVLVVDMSHSELTTELIETKLLPPPVPRDSGSGAWRPPRLRRRHLRRGHRLAAAPPDALHGRRERHHRHRDVTDRLPRLSVQRGAARYLLRR